jgi:beta-phosphoglucomutase-like phosphatase (HAD superfamily)
VWDVDGTLVDTAALHRAAWERVSAEMGRPFSAADFASTFGRRNPDILSYLFGDGLAEGEVRALAERKESYYRSAARPGVALLPGVAELLSGLEVAGFLQAIGSSARSRRRESRRPHALRGHGARRGRARRATAPVAHS